MHVGCHALRQASIITAIKFGQESRPGLRVTPSMSPPAVGLPAGGAQLGLDEIELRRGPRRINQA